VPEGDTVYRAAKKLDAALGRRRLDVVDLRVPDHATVDLAGAEHLGTVSRGKHLLTRLRHEGSDWTLHTHLKMEGSWHVYEGRARWRRPTHQARAVLRAGTTTAVGFSLGVVDLLRTADEPDVVGHVGPDLLGPDWDEEEALRRLRADGHRPVAEALLDQRNLAGIGNMYMAELCFVSGVHPARPLADVPDLVRMVRRARQMLDLNKERAMQSTTGDLRQGRQLWVYRRDQQACRRCGTPVRVEMRVDAEAPLRGERASYWCPSCQPR